MTKLTYEPRVGMKVVCLRGPNPKTRGNMSNSNGERHHTEDANFPEKGQTYTIRHVNFLPGQTTVLLNEVRNDHLTAFFRQGLEPGFSARHFEATE